MPRDRKDYDLARYYRRRAEIIAYLGGVCAKCGTTNDLQVDHIDPSSKSFEISQNALRAWAILVEELKKCQLLCREHHVQKWRDNHEHTGGQNKWLEIKHGTLHAYRQYKCRCDLCREAKREEGRRYRAKWAVSGSN